MCYYQKVLIFKMDENQSSLKFTLRSISKLITILLLSTLPVCMVASLLLAILAEQPLNLLDDAAASQLFSVLVGLPLIGAVICTLYLTVGMCSEIRYIAAVWRNFFTGKRVI